MDSDQPIEYKPKPHKRSTLKRSWNQSIYESFHERKINTSNHINEIENGSGVKHLAPQCEYAKTFKSCSNMNKSFKEISNFNNSPIDGNEEGPSTFEGSCNFSTVGNNYCGAKQYHSKQLVVTKVGNDRKIYMNNNVNKVTESNSARILHSGETRKNTAGDGFQGIKTFESKKVPNCAGGHNSQYSILARRNIECKEIFERIEKIRKIYDSCNSRSINFLTFANSPIGNFDEINQSTDSSTCKERGSLFVESNNHRNANTEQEKEADESHPDYTNCRKKIKKSYTGNEGITDFVDVPKQEINGELKESSRTDISVSKLAAYIKTEKKKLNRDLIEELSSTHIANSFKQDSVKRKSNSDLVVEGRKGSLLIGISSSKKTDTMQTKSNGLSTEHDKMSFNDLPPNRNMAAQSSSPVINFPVTKVKEDGSILSNTFKTQGKSSTHIADDIETDSIKSKSSNDLVVEYKEDLLFLGISSGEEMGIFESENNCLTAKQDNASFNYNLPNCNLTTHPSSSVISDPIRNLQQECKLSNKMDHNSSTHFAENKEIDSGKLISSNYDLAVESNEDMLFIQISSGEETDTFKTKNNILSTEHDRESFNYFLPNYNMATQPSPTLVNIPVVQEEESKLSNSFNIEGNYSTNIANSVETDSLKSKSTNDLVVEGKDSLLIVISSGEEIDTLETDNNCLSAEQYNASFNDLLNYNMAAQSSSPVIKFPVRKMQEESKLSDTFKIEDNSSTHIEDNIETDSVKSKSNDLVEGKKELLPIDNSSGEEIGTFVTENNCLSAEHDYASFNDVLPNYNMAAQSSSAVIKYSVRNVQESKLSNVFKMEDNTFTHVANSIITDAVKSKTNADLVVENNPLYIDISSDKETDSGFETEERNRFECKNDVLSAEQDNASLNDRMLNCNMASQSASPVMNFPDVQEEENNLSDIFKIMENSSTHITDNVEIESVKSNNNNDLVVERNEDSLFTDVFSGKEVDSFEIKNNRLSTKHGKSSFNNLPNCSMAVQPSSSLISFQVRQVQEEQCKLSNIFKMGGRCYYQDSSKECTIASANETMVLAPDTNSFQVNSSMSVASVRSQLKLDFGLSDVHEALKYATFKMSSKVINNAKRFKNNEEHLSNVQMKMNYKDSEASILPVNSSVFKNIAKETLSRNLTKTAAKSISYSKTPVSRNRSSIEIPKLMQRDPVGDISAFIKEQRNDSKTVSSRQQIETKMPRKSRKRCKLCRNKHLKKKIKLGGLQREEVKAPKHPDFSKTDIRHEARQKLNKKID